MTRWLAVVLATVLGIAVLLPLGRLGAQVVADPGSLAILAEPQELRAAANTAIVALGTTAFALALGLPLGVLFARADLPGVERWRTLATLPYVIPPYVSAIAWITLCNPTTGWLNAPLVALGLPPLDVYGLAGMVWVMGLECTPIVMLATADALSRMDASLEEQARVAGASPLQVIRRVTLPLAAPTLVASASFVLAAAASSFGVPYLLASGTADPDWVLTTRIAQSLDLDPATGRSRAVALSLVLLVGTLSLPLLTSFWLGRGRFTTVGGKATRPARLSLGRLRPVALALVAAFVLAGVVLPLGTLVLLSVTDQFGRGLAPSNLSLASYAEVLGRPRDQLAIGRSALLAAGAATAAVAVGAAVALLETRSRARWLGWLARVPYTVPGTVLALGLLLTWSQEIRFVLLDRVTLVLALADTGWLLLLAYAVKFLALPVGGLGAALQAIDPALEEAARVSGASPWRSLRRITLPILRPSLIAAWFLVFLPAFTEVTMSVLLGGPRTRVVGVLLFDLQTYGDPPAAAALAVVVSAVVIALHSIVARWGT